MENKLFRGIEKLAESRGGNVANKSHVLFDCVMAEAGMSDLIPGEIRSVEMNFSSWKKPTVADVISDIKSFLEA